MNQFEEGLLPVAVERGIERIENFGDNLRVGGPVGVDELRLQGQSPTPGHRKRGDSVAQRLPSRCRWVLGEIGDIVVGRVLEVLPVKEKNPLYGETGGDLVETE